VTVALVVVAFALAALAVVTSTVWALTVTLTVVGLAAVVLAVVLNCRASKSRSLLSGNVSGMSSDFKNYIFDSLETPVAGFCDKKLSVWCSIRGQEFLHCLNQHQFLSAVWSCSLCPFIVKPVIVSSRLISWATIETHRSMLNPVQTISSTPCQRIAINWL